MIRSRPLSPIPLGALRLALLLALFLTACGPTLRQEPDNLFWPAPPDQPRIKYLSSIYTEDDIGREYSLKERLFGKDYIDTFGRPYGVYAGGNRLFIADLMMRGVAILDLDRKRMFTVNVPRNALQNPSGIVTDENGVVYIADASLGRVVVCNPDYSYRTVYRVDDGRLVAIAINRSLGRLYVVDRNAHQVHVLDLAGKKLFDFGGQGVKDGKMNLPLGIAVDRSGKVYVLDGGNFRVQIFDADGRFLSKFGSVGDRPGTFANPKGVAVDSDGHIYVTDSAFSNVQIFDQQGRILLFFGSLGPDPGQLHLPGGIAIDEQDRIFIADQLNKRIEVFQYLKESAPGSAAK